MESSLQPSRTSWPFKAGAKIAGEDELIRRRKSAISEKYGSELWRRIRVNPYGPFKIVRMRVI